MATLRFLWIIHTTSTRANADTDDPFRLEVRERTTPPPGGSWRFLPFPDLPSPDEKQQGVTEQYRFDLTAETGHLSIDMDTLTPDGIAVTIRGVDAWLPSSIWAIGEDVNGARRLLAGVPNWPTSVSRGWFSEDPTEGRMTRSLG